MLSRWYSIFVGILLLVLGIAGFFGPRVFGMATGTFVWTSIVWIITAVVGLWYGFAVRDLASVRWFAGVVGVIYLIWGIIMVATAGSATSGILASLGGITLLLGALGLAASLVPAYWLNEQELMAPGTV